MKNLMLVAALSLGVAVGGCPAEIRSEEIEPTDLLAIVVGADRETVEDVLGGPDDSVETEMGRMYTYRYVKSVGPWPLSGTGSSSESYIDPQLLLHLWLIYITAQPQKGELSITYGPDDTVVRIETAGERDDRELQEELSVVRVGATREAVEAVLGESQRHKDARVHVYRHERGNAKVMMYVTYGPDGTLTRAETATQRREEKKRREPADLLARAQCGDARAQFDLGSRYSDGRGMAQDLARAYFWYGVAHTGGVGRPPRLRPSLSGQITPEQIAQGERLIAEWEPKDCGNGDAGNVAAN